MQSAPWAVFVRQSRSARPRASAAARSSTRSHVLTAAHCVYARTARRGRDALPVRAGISNSTRPLGGDAEQDRGVLAPRPSRVRWADRGVGRRRRRPRARFAARSQRARGPGRRPPGAGRRLSPPTPRSGSPASAARTAASLRRLAQLARAGSTSRARAVASETRDPRRRRRRVLCAAPTGAVCSGDSGSGLVTTGPSRGLIGVVSAGRQAGCAIGSAHDLHGRRRAGDPPVRPGRRRTRRRAAPDAGDVRALFWDPPLVRRRGAPLLLGPVGRTRHFTLRVRGLERATCSSEGPNRHVPSSSARSVGDILSCRAYRDERGRRRGPRDRLGRRGRRAAPDDRGHLAPREDQDDGSSAVELSRRPGDRGAPGRRGKSGHRRAGCWRKPGGESRRKVAQKGDRLPRISGDTAR